MNLKRKIEIEVTKQEVCELTAQYETDDICDVLLHHKNYRPRQSKMVFERVVSDFKEEASELISKFVKAEPEYTDGMSAINVDKLIENFTDYIDRNY